METSETIEKNRLKFFSSHELNLWGVLDYGYFEQDCPLSFDRFLQWNDQINDCLHYLKDHRQDLRSSLVHHYPAFQSGLIFLFSYAETKKYCEENHFHRVLSVPVMTYRSEHIARAIDSEA